jgi:hypothetical protein
MWSRTPTIREHWDEIYALCKLNSLPFNATGEVMENDGVWRVYEFDANVDLDNVGDCERLVLSRQNLSPLEKLPHSIPPAA